MSYILFYKENEVISIEKKQPNRIYNTQHSMEEIETEEALILRIKDIDEDYKYVTEEERKKVMEDRTNLNEEEIEM